MNVFANGFVACHVEVNVASGRTADVKAVVKGWQDEFRRLGRWPCFPGSLLERLTGVDGVTSATSEGPQSSLSIPLRMVGGMTAATCTLSTVLGCGPVARSIEEGLDAHGIALDPAGRVADADSPIEFSFRDPGGGSTSLVVYPASRRRYVGSVGTPRTLPDHLMLNRFNRGLAGLGARVCASGGSVSFRPRELGRHDRIEDQVSLLPIVDLLVLSSRHGTMRHFARHAGIRPPSGWPDKGASLPDEEFERLGRWLLERMRAGGVVLLHRHGVGDSAFFAAGRERVIVEVPAGYGSESRAARLQGSLSGQALLSGSRSLAGLDGTAWRRCCRAVVARAYRGTGVRPWRYPERDEDPPAR